MSAQIINFPDVPFKPEGEGPWITLKVANRNVHVFPAQMIENIIEGKNKLTKCDDWEDLTKAIFKEWLDYILTPEWER